MAKQRWPYRGIYKIKESQYDEDWSGWVRITRWIRAYREAQPGIEAGYEYIAICDRDMDGGFSDFEGNPLPSNAWIGEQGHFEQSEESPHVLFAPHGFADYMTIELVQSLEDIEADNVLNGPNEEQVL